MWIMAMWPVVIIKTEQHTVSHKGLFTADNHEHLYLWYSEIFTQTQQAAAGESDTNQTFKHRTWTQQRRITITAFMPESYSEQTARLQRQQKDTKCVF